MKTSEQEQAGTIRKKETAQPQLRQVELRLLAELMKNSRRSDRELSKEIGVSQPTVSRLVKKLEKKGVIREYTMIPDFTKIGYALMGITFLKLDESRLQDPGSIRETGLAHAQNSPYALLLCDSGMGLGFDGVLLTLYKDYSEYSLHMGFTKQFPFIKIDAVQSFIIDLTRGFHFHPLSLSTLANILSATRRTDKANDK